MVVFQADNGNGNVNVNVSVNGNGPINGKGNQAGSSILIKAEDCNDPLLIDPGCQDISILRGDTNSASRQKTTKELSHDNSEKKTEIIDAASGE